MTEEERKKRFTEVTNYILKRIREIEEQKEKDPGQHQVDNKEKV